MHLPWAVVFHIEFKPTVASTILFFLWFSANIKKYVALQFMLSHLQYDIPSVKGKK